MEIPSRYPSPPEPDQFVINGTRASNPRAIQLELLRYYRFFPFGPALVLALIVVLVGAAVLLSPFLLVLPFLLLVLAGRHVKYLRQLFYCGDVNGGIVVSERPCLVAIYTDLTQGGLPCPVVKVIEQPLDRAFAYPPPIRTRVATAALYFGTIGGSAWDDFDPITVNLGTSDAEVIRRALESIPQGNWDFLEQAIRLLPRPFAPGLYRVFQAMDGSPARLVKDSQRE